ncbi:MAG: dipeptide ABC transporter ATP-binding protein [Phycisphaerae bacterium]|nr:dipeptide ABC transporter ATP-binding protein [Phycisphaerae bacterium]
MSSERADPGPLLRAEELRTHFAVRGGGFGSPRRILKAVDGVSFELRRGRTLGLVGESGCGKSTLARSILRLVPITAGQVFFAGQDVFALPRRDLRRLRRTMQIIFQDPVGSLNPRLRVETIVGEALRVHGLVKTARQARERLAELLIRVGLSPDDLLRYPHEFSGGQRQRIGIARALALEPSLIVCDEPVSALDVSIQAQILNLLADLQRDFGLSYIFIAHNLAVVQHISDEVAVMYLGRIVEQCPAAELYRDPRHPYTRALLAAAPRLAGPNGATRNTPLLSGEPPSPIDPPAGCAFHPRCPLAEPRCRVEPPQLHARAGLPGTHLVACHLAEQSHNAQDLRP